MGEHVILVAFSVEGESRREAEEGLLNLLPRPGEAWPRPNGRARIDSWWQADEDRIDGSDNDSAVFVRPGYGNAASTLLFEAGMTGSYNIVNASPIWEGPET